MTQTGVAGRLPYPSPEDRLFYLQRVAEEAGDGVITKTNGTIINARAGIDLIAGTNIALTGVDDPTNNHVAVTIDATGSAAVLGDPVAVAHGGTARTTLLANAVLVGNGTGAVTMLAPGTNGQILAMVAGSPQWSNLDGGSP